MRQFLKTITLAAVAAFGLLAFNAPSAQAQGWGGHQNLTAEEDNNRMYLHEAGHVIYLLLNPNAASWLISVTTSPAREGYGRSASGGTTTNFPGPHSGTANLQYYVEFTSAGACASQMFFGFATPNEIHGDQVHAKAILQQAQVPPHKIAVWLEEASNRACRTLNGYAPVIRMLAQELMQRGYLPGDYIRRKYGPMVAGGYR